MHTSQATNNGPAAFDQVRSDPSQMLFPQRTANRNVHIKGGVRRTVRAQSRSSNTPVIVGQGGPRRDHAPALRSAADLRPVTLSYGLG